MPELETTSIYGSEGCIGHGIVIRDRHLTRIEADYIVALVNAPSREVEELAAIHARFGGAPSWETVSRNFERFQRERDVAQGERDQLRALVREAIGLVDPNTDPMDESAYCDWLEKARAIVSPEAAGEGRK
jgi:hypothetical protein